MAKVDLHVHSKYSDYPSTWAHKMYDSPESFTEPETVYQQAKSRGMDLVTITDHDDIRGSLELYAAHPQDTFVSCEITSYFPADNCKVHILVYGITENQYEHIMRIRRNLFILRDYIVEQRIAYSVAHATYDQDGKLSFEHIEQLVLLFDVFEVINGGADAQNNLLLHRYLQKLDDQKLDELQAKHKIKPISTDPWVKGYTGGSDDHCGILIGSAFTQSLSQTPAQFLDALRNKSSLANGMHGSFESYATGVIKHIHDYRLDRDPKYGRTKMNDFLEMFFVGEEGGLVKRFKKSHSIRYLKRKNTRTHKALHKLLRQINDDKELDIASKIPVTYEYITSLHDEMFTSVVKAFSKNMPSGNIFKGLDKLATLFPMALLASPFLGSMRHQVLKSQIKQALIEGTDENYTHKALWVTDTIDDLNGVSVTLHQIAQQSQVYGYQMKLVTCVDEAKIQIPLPLNTINFTPVESIEVPGYEQQKVGFPSLLTMMKRIIKEQPDQIIISTPGPLGWGALLCGKLMDLPIKAVYHTDFGEQIVCMTDESLLANITDACVNAFYKQCDQVFVPSQAYIDKLTQAGLLKQRLEIFPRGLNTQLYSPAKEQSSTLIRRHQLHGRFTLLFAGRISEDKNLALLAKIYQHLETENPGFYNLVFAGDGPDVMDLKNTLSGQSNTFFTGRLSPDELVEWYRCADLLVFPSHTDTFGMVVLEAQACGLPCLVTATGGPKEIIEPNNTGHIVDTDNIEDWAVMIDYYQQLKHSAPSEFQALRERCSLRVQQQNSWRPIFENVLGDECLLPTIDADSNSNIRPTAPDTPELAA